MRLALLLMTACAATFVWITAASLPAMMASHFDASGAANGFMQRASYVHFMLAIVVAAPLATGLLPGLLLQVPGIRINLPNRDYWLAPERRAATIASLQRQMAGFAVLLVIFLAYVHWLTVRANQTIPPTLPSRWFFGGLIVFVVAVALWIGVLNQRFRLPSQRSQ